MDGLGFVRSTHYHTLAYASVSAPVNQMTVPCKSTLKISILFNDKTVSFKMMM